MKATELRIGNYIYFDHPANDDLFVDGIKFVDGINDGFVICENNNYDLNNCFGRQLTEEWLLKFGFTRQSNAYNCHHKNDFSIWSPKGSNRFDLNDTINNVPEIMYVHQLQNLYFALTGNELTLK